MDVSTIVQPDAGLTVYEVHCQEPCLRAYVEKFWVTIIINFVAHTGVPSCILLGKHLSTCTYMRINNTEIM